MNPPKLVFQLKNQCFDADPNNPLTVQHACFTGLSMSSLRLHNGFMNQTELAMLMNSLGRSKAEFDPIVSIAFLAEFLERAELTLEKSDYQNLLYVGACIHKLLLRHP